MIKKLLFVFLFAGITNSSFSQFYKSILPSPEFSNAIEKIVLDFRKDYQTIQGEQLEKQGEMEVYNSLVKLPGVEVCKILRFHSRLDTTAGWQATIYDGDDYKEAVRAYQNTVRLVKKSRIKWIDKSIVGFTGELQAPREELRFTTTTLHLDLDDRRYKDFEAQIELLSTYSGFTVQLNLHKKTKENPFD